jgi:hypothetical protein
VVSLLFRFVTHSSHSYSAQITAHCQCFPAQVVARWLEKHSSVNVDFVVIAQVGSTHRFSTAPESRRTVNSFPPRWWHGGLRSTAPSMSILLSSPRWGRLIAFLQRPNHGALSFLSRPGGGNTLAMRFLHMARLCHGTLSFLSRPGGGNTLATAYCCIWHAYATVSTGQRLPFASWLLGSVTMRHCGAVSLSRSLLTIVSSFSISPVVTSCSTIVMRLHPL